MVTLVVSNSLLNLLGLGLNMIIYVMDVEIDPNSGGKGTGIYLRQRLS